MFGAGLDSEHVFAEHTDMQRTYVRRRLGVLLLVIGLVSAVGGPVARALGSADDMRPAQARTYVVRPGDSLWSIASMLAPDRDPRRVVVELDEANGGSLDTLVPGRALSIPSTL
jgi:LysM domain